MMMAFQKIQEWNIISIFFNDRRENGNFETIKKFYVIETLFQNRLLSIMTKIITTSSFFKLLLRVLVTLIKN